MDPRKVRVWTATVWPGKKYPFDINITVQNGIMLPSNMGPIKVEFGQQYGRKYSDVLY